MAQCIRLNWIWNALVWRKNWRLTSEFCASWRKKFGIFHEGNLSFPILTKWWDFNFLELIDLLPSTWRKGGSYPPFVAFHLESNEFTYPIQSNPRHQTWPMFFWLICDMKHLMFFEYCFWFFKLLLFFEYEVTLHLLQVGIIPWLILSTRVSKFVCRLFKF